MTLTQQDFKTIAMKFREGCRSIEVFKGEELMVIDYEFWFEGYQEEETGGNVVTGVHFTTNVECVNEDGKDMPHNFDENEILKLIA